jgi:hypothetical protein
VKTTTTAEEIDVIIRIARDDSDLVSFLSSHGVKTKPHYGIFNGPMPDMQEMLKHPAPYVWATAAASVVITALRAYVKIRHKRIIIQKLKTGVTIDATNFSPAELKEIGVVDLIELQAAKEQDKSP